VAGRARRRSLPPSCRSRRELAAGHERPVDFGIDVRHAKGSFTEEPHLRLRLERDGDHRPCARSSARYRHSSERRALGEPALESTSAPSVAFNAIIPNNSTRSLRRGGSKTLARPSVLAREPQ
jgi:hypothetical protein